MSSSSCQQRYRRCRVISVAGVGFGCGQENIFRPDVGGKIVQFTRRNQVGLHTDALEHGYVGTQFLGILERDYTNETGLPKTALATYHFVPIAEIGITTQC